MARIVVLIPSFKGLLFKYLICVQLQCGPGLNPFF